jgi:hypothetical protein
MQQLIAAVELRERVLMFLDMVTGLRRGELAGLKWADIDFLNLQINVTRSVVDQHVGKCKTEISQKTGHDGRVHGFRSHGLVSADSFSCSRGLGICHQQQSGRAQAGRATAVAVQDHEPSYSTDRQKVGNHKAHWLVQVPAHLLKHAEGEWRGM